ncbi:hypothetical protein H0W32_03075, partial [Patescibacteria group bacterium]|nr:hypothetical protein [Patescibacteria group bacterium]
IIAFYTGTGTSTLTGTERWRVTEAGAFQANGAQTIQTSSGALTLSANSAVITVGGTSGNVGVGTTSPAGIFGLDTTGIGQTYNAYFSGRVAQENGAGVKIAPRIQLVGTAKTNIYALDVTPQFVDNIAGLDSTNLASIHVGNTTNINTGITNQYGLYVEALSGATNNYGAYFGSNVGIGTSSPYAKLSVTGQVVGEYFTSTSTAQNTFGGSVVVSSGSAMSTGAGISMYYSSGGVLESYSNAAVGISSAMKVQGSTLKLYSASVAAGIDINSNANVGIGTTTPWKKLSVSGDMVLTGALFDRTASAGTNGMILQTTGSATQWVATSSLGFASATQIGSGTTGQFPYYAGSGTDLTATSSLFLATSGNVGIGTTSPGALVHALGTGDQLRLGYDASNYTRFITSSSGNLSIIPTGTAVSITGTAAVSANLEFSTAGTHYLKHIGGTASTDKFTFRFSDNQDVMSVSGDGTVNVEQAIYANGYGSVFGGSSTYGATTTLTVRGNNTGGTYAAVIKQGTVPSSWGFRVVDNTDGHQFGVNSLGQTLIATGTAAIPAFAFNGDTNTGLFSSFLDTLSFATAGNERVTINSSGNVGIGTTSPISALSVQGSSGSMPSAYIVNTSGSSNAGGLFVETTEGNGSGDALKVVTFRTNSPKTMLRVQNYGSLGGNVLLVESGYGNVGIGTTTPWKKLSVTGDMVLTGAFFDRNASAGTNGMVLQTNGSGTQWVATSSLGFMSGTAIGSGTTGQFPYYAGGGTTLTATSSLFLATSGN